MPYETDVSGEAYGDINEQEDSCGAVLGIVLGSELQEYICEYRHCKSADPDSIPVCEKEERDSDEDGIEQKKEDETTSSDEDFYLISEKIEEETIGDKMEDPGMEELVEEELDRQLDIESLHKEERIHSECKDIAYIKRYSRHDEREDDEDIREAFILHVS